MSKIINLDDRRILREMASELSQGNPKQRENALGILSSNCSFEGYPEFNEVPLGKFVLYLAQEYESSEAARHLFHAIRARITHTSKEDYAAAEGFSPVQIAANWVNHLINQDFFNGPIYRDVEGKSFSQMATELQTGRPLSFEAEENHRVPADLEKPLQTMLAEITAKLAKRKAEVVLDQERGLA